MYLSKVEIDVHNRNRIRDLTDLESYHGWIEDSFSREHEKDGERTRKLWRIDCVGERYFLLIVSPYRPYSRALAKYGVSGTARTIDYDRFLDSLQENQGARFKLVANPTFTKTIVHNQRGHIKNCLDYQSQIDYLCKKSQKNGFQLMDSQYTVTGKKMSYISKHAPNARFQKVCYEGRLRITNVVKFKEMLCNGVGREKAYGCGLMTIIPEKS